MTLVILQTNVPDFIEPSNWPPNSRDLNLVDYSVWGALPQLVYHQKLKNIDSLKQVLNWLNNCWDMISQKTNQQCHYHWSK